MYRLGVEIIFSILLVYPMDFLTLSDVKAWKDARPELASFQVMTEADIAGWQGPVVKMPTKYRR